MTAVINPYIHEPRVLLLQDVVGTIWVRIWPYNDLRWQPMDKPALYPLQTSLSLSTNSPTPEG